MFLKKPLVISIFLLSSLLYSSEVTFDREEMLQKHNELRSRHNSPPLHYSKKLEKAAKKWAKVLKKGGCTMVHSHGKVGDYGENLFWASPLTTIRTDANNHKTYTRKLQKVNASQVAQAWYDEISFYDYDTNSCKKGEMCGHFTQLVWDTTTELGCYAISCDDKSQVWVCEYSPAGNISLRHQDGKIEKLRPYTK